MSELAPLETFLDEAHGTDLSLPDVLAKVYGRLRFPVHPDRPHVIGNFVGTLDGVVSLGLPGKASGREISGDNPHDRLVMGLLRAAADAVIVGAGTFRASSKRRWTADAAYPPFGNAFQALRANLGKPDLPVNVVVSASGDLDLARPPDGAGVPLLVVTTVEGARALRRRGLPPGVEIVERVGPVSAWNVVDVARRAYPGELILAEAGPRLMGDFVAEGCLDELFLTIAPQIAGRDGMATRPGLIAGKRFAPHDERWATLVSLKRAGSHLFTRYAMTPSPTARCQRRAENPT